MITINVHRIQSIRLGEIGLLTNAGKDYYARDLVIKTADGEEKFTLWSDNGHGLLVEDKELSEIRS